MANSTIVTNTDPNVDASFPKVTGTTSGAKHALDTAVINQIETYKKDEARVIDEVSTTLLYVGTAAIGSATSSAVWKIQKISTSGVVTSFKFANGENTYVNIWDNRASLTYS